MKPTKKKETNKRIQNKQKSKVSLQLCRTCLLEKNKEDMKEINDIGNILKDIVPIKFVKKDGWPNDICSDCVIEANHAYEFRVMCVKSDEILTKRMTENLKIKNISDNTDTNSSDLNIDSQTEVYIKEEESFVKDDEDDLETLKMEDISFEKCDIKEEVCEDKEEESKVCERSEVVNEKEKESGMCTDDDNDEPEKNQIKRRRKRKQLRCCGYCDMEFKDKSDLEKHKENHLTERICHICNRHKETVSSYKTHMSRHKKQGTYICKTCGKSFEFPDSLHNHEQIHSNVRPHKCTKCDKTFIIANNLKKHLAVAHAQVKPFVCNICGKQFGVRANLNRHIELQHVLSADQRPYVCACGKSFREKGKLTHHQNSVHTSVRKYVCDLCEKSFKCNQALSMHKKVHETIKPFVCDICGYASTFRNSLNIHMRVHSKPISNKGSESD